MRGGELDLLVLEHLSSAIAVGLGGERLRDVGTGRSTLSAIAMLDAPWSLSGPGFQAAFAAVTATYWSGTAAASRTYPSTADDPPPRQ